jgi:hypothetical protein
MTTNGDPTNWETMVRCYNANTGSYDTTQQTIPESDPCITMPDIPPGPLGRPIDTNLAVNLISDFYERVNDAYGPTDLGGLAAEEILNLYNNARTFLNCLVNLDYGMTIDKNFALKLLSQPKCEGLRVYLCFKNDDSEAPISLVTVGVDSDGFDLKYNTADTVIYQDVVNEDGESGDKPVLAATPQTPAVKNVEMRSLNGEYVTPPYSLIFTELSEKAVVVKPDLDFYSRFILLNIATGKRALLRLSRSSS